jgi:hypothetical protein
VAVGNDDDEGVRSGDRGSETGWVGDVRMLADRVVDGAEGDGGGGSSIHRGWAAGLKDQVPLGDGLRLRKESLLGLPLSLVADGGEAISGGRCGFRWSSLGRLRCGLLGLGRRGWWWWWLWCDVTSGTGGDVLSRSLIFHRQNGVGGRSECGSSCGSRSGAGSESSDLCSQGLDRLLQGGDNFLVLALSRCSCGSGGRVGVFEHVFERVDASLGDARGYEKKRELSRKINSSETETLDQNSQFVSNTVWPDR